MRTQCIKRLLVLIMISSPQAIALQHEGPARVWGDLSVNYRQRDSGGTDTTNTNLRHTGSVSTSSYLWRPWFASFNGSLSLSVDETDTAGQPSSENEFTSGDVQLDLFPTSRFPFRAYYIENQNEFVNDQFNETISTTEYGLSQRYRNSDGTASYYAEYGSNDQDQGNRERFESETLLLSGSNRIDKNVVDTDISASSVDRKLTDEHADSYSITLDHGFGSGTNFFFDNLLSTSLVENDLFASDREVYLSQLSSFLLWQPGDSGDLRLTGSMRLSETSILEEGPDVLPDGRFETENFTQNLNQGLIYDYSRNLQFSEAVNLSQVETDGREVSTTAQSLGTRYSADRIETNLGEYGWSYSATYSRLGGDVETEELLSNQLSQSLLSTRSLDSGYQFRRNLTQSLNYNYRTNDEDDRTIDHSYSAAWTKSSFNQQTLFRFFVSDSRDLYRGNDFFQLANLQYSGSSRLSRYSQFSGNATLQYSSQSFDSEQSQQTVGNGQLKYVHNRFLQVPNLVFVTQLQLSERQSEIDRLIQGSEEEDSQVTLENTLRYRIGRLETQFELDFVEVGDDFDTVIQFQLKRSFGDL